jgi:hypothetical protein
MILDIGPVSVCAPGPLSAICFVRDLYRYAKSCPDPSRSNRDSLDSSPAASVIPSMVSSSRLPWVSPANFVMVCLPFSPAFRANVRLSKLVCTSNTPLVPPERFVNSPMIDPFHVSYVSPHFTGPTRNCVPDAGLSNAPPTFFVSISPNVARSLTVSINPDVPPGDVHFFPSSAQPEKLRVSSAVVAGLFPSCPVPVSLLQANTVPPVVSILPSPLVMLNLPLPL